MEVHTKPFPHVVQDELIPEFLLERIHNEWPEQGWNKEDGKFQTKWHQSVPEEWKEYEERLKAPEFCKSIADLFGIEDELFVPDDFGAGLHCIPRGGYLRMHTDFLNHPDGHRRRVNLLLYLNREWRDEWCGHLVLGIGDTKTIAPVGGRVVIFPTGRDTWHGHPDPLACPEHVQRRSLAVYYYSAGNGVPDKTVWEPK